MEIHTTTQLDYKTYRHLWYFSVGRKYYKFIQIVVLFSATFVLILLGIHDYLNRSEYRVPFFMSMCWFFTMLGNFSAPKTAYDRRAYLYDSPLEFTFNEDEFLIINNSRYHPGTSTIKYNQLHKAYETDKSFYLYPDKKTIYPVEKKTVYPVEKDGISLEEIAQLRDRLQTNLGRGKYIRCI